MTEVLPPASDISAPQPREKGQPCTRCSELEEQLAATMGALQKFYETGIADGVNDTRRRLGLPSRDEPPSRRSRTHGLNSVVVLAALLMLTMGRLVTSPAAPAPHPHGRRPAAAVSSPSVPIRSWL